VTTPGGAPLLHLPVVYAVALALRDAGLTMDEIASRLELPRESMPALVEIAEAKLLSLTAVPPEAIDLSNVEDRDAAHPSDPRVSSRSTDRSDKEP
jgi:hypothetical protein